MGLARRTAIIAALSAGALTLVGFGEPGGSALAAATVAPKLAVDALTTTWRDNSLTGSTGTPQPLPTTTADCGAWTGGDGTQVVRLSNGDNLLSLIHI